MKLCRHWDSVHVSLSVSCATGWKKYGAVQLLINAALDRLLSLFREVPTRTICLIVLWSRILDTFLTMIRPQAVEIRADMTQFVLNCMKLWSLWYMDVSRFLPEVSVDSDFQSSEGLESFPGNMFLGGHFQDHFLGREIGVLRC